MPLLVGLGVDELSVGAARVGAGARLDPRARSTSARGPRTRRCSAGGDEDVVARGARYCRRGDAAGERVDARRARRRRRPGGVAALPPFAPSARTERRLFALTSRSFAITAMLRAEPHRGPHELRGGPRVQVDAGGQRDESLRTWRRHEPPPRPRRPRRAPCPAEATTAAAIAPSTERRIDEPHGAVAVRPSSSTRANGEDRAAEVAEHDRAVALVGGGDRGAHERRRRCRARRRDRRRRPRYARRGRPSARASAAVPAAISRLCDTITIPTTQSPF